MINFANMFIKSQYQYVIFMKRNYIFKPSYYFCYKAFSNLHLENQSWKLYNYGYRDKCLISSFLFILRLFYSLVCI